MGSIQQTLKEYASGTASWSLQTADVTSADWDLTEAVDYQDVVNAVNAIVLGTQADVQLAPVRTYTPSVAAPTNSNAQLGVRWDIFGTDAVNGRKYLLASIPTADSMAGGSTILLPNSDQADPDNALVSALFTALDEVALQTPADNAVVAGSYEMFLNQRRDYKRPT